MELQLSDDQQLFVDATRRFLNDTSSIAATRALGDDAAGFGSDWWQQGAALGWTSMLAPEAAGGGAGADSNVSDLAQIAFERGRLVAPGPFTSANVAIAALALAADSNEDLIEGAMSGTAVVTVAVDEPGRGWGATGRATTATADGDEIVIDGTKSLVEAGANADAFVVVAQGASGPVMVLVPADTAGVVVEARRSADLVRRFAEIRFDGVRVPASSLLSDDAAAIGRCLDVGVVLQLAETIGALDRVLEFTKEWMFDRYTFGRPLASYQELKHRVADMTLWLEASKATVSAAARAMSVDADDAAELVAVAASYVDEHGVELVQDCVQLHGGIGVTWEHDIHLYLRRVTINSLTYGTVNDHRDRLAADLIDQH